MTTEGASRWEVRHTAPRAFHAVLVAGNGEDIVWSESYTTRKRARNAIELAVLLGPAAFRHGRVRNVEAAS